MNTARESKEKQAVAKAIKSGLSFAFFIFPNETEEHFFATTRDCNILDGSSFDEFNGFVFNEFSLDPNLRAFGISPDLTCEDVMNNDFNVVKLPRPEVAVQNSTLKNDYLHQAQRIISELNSDEEKTVLSHLKKINSEKPFLDIADGYFKTMTNCFRFIFYTPDSGLWFGASPELLLRHDSKTQEIDSMSLAGTRSTDEGNRAWDIKNKIEHDLVTKFIVNVLKDHGLHVDEPTESNLRFGNITHLCHHIHALGHVRLAQLINCLSPTPALLGWPREQAYRQILENEYHKRKCYGGFIGYKHDNITNLFVNLRSGMAWGADTPHCVLNLFSGGGLTARSVPEAEWDEAESKLTKIIEQI